MGRIEDRLREVGITLPAVPLPVANYLPAKRFGNLAQTAGQVSVLGDREYKGKLGATLERGVSSPPGNSWCFARRPGS